MPDEGNGTPENPEQPESQDNGKPKTRTKFVAYITRNGVRIYAKSIGKKAWPIQVPVDPEE